VTSGNIASYSTFFFNENNGYQVGSAFFAGKAVIKLSAGSWGAYKTFSYNANEFLYTIDCRNSNTCITGGFGGYVYRTFNGGANWDTVKSAVDSSIYSLKFVNNSTILGATEDPMGGIIISNDTGRTWQKDMNTLTFSYPQFRGMVLSKRDSFIAVGKVSNDTVGVILSYRNGYPQADGAQEPLNGVAMANDSIAYAVGDSGLIISNRHKLLVIPQPFHKEPEIILYPNPSSGFVTVKLKSLFSISIIDLLGKLIKEDDLQSKEHFVDLSNTTPGIYFVEIKMKEGGKYYRTLVLK
jgi:hypothetical protein